MQSGNKIFEQILQTHPTAITVSTKIFLFTVFTNSLSIAVNTDISSVIMLATAFSTSPL